MGAWISFKQPLTRKQIQSHSIQEDRRTTFNVSPRRIRRTVTNVVGPILIRTMGVKLCVRRELHTLIGRGVHPPKANDAYFLPPISKKFINLRFPPNL